MTSKCLVFGNLNWFYSKYGKERSAGTRQLNLQLPLYASDYKQLNINFSTSVYCSVSA